MRKLAVALVLLGAFAEPALAQSSLGIGAAEVPVQPGSGAFFVWIAAQQQQFFTGLRQALVALRTDPDGLWWLAGLSFLYGVFHAAGPGHGKAVISSYMLANEVQLRRGIVLSFASALFQALAALVLVAAGWYLLRGSAISMTQAGRAMELASYALVAGFGVYLLAAKARRAWRRRAVAGLATGGLAFADAGAARAPIMRPASGGLAGEICDDTDDCGCGRAHIADPRVLTGERVGFRSGVSAVLAVGLRPCSGAIVVLTFALVNGLYAAGILSVLAMALGTAITVSALATLAVASKDLALRYSGRSGGIVGEIIEIAGAMLLVLLGLALLAGSLQLPL